MIERSDYMGNPVIVLKRDAADRFPLTFGMNKARLILANLAELEKFVRDCSEGVDAHHAAKDKKARSNEKAHITKPGILNLQAFRGIDDDICARLLALKPYCVKCEVTNGLMTEQSIALAIAEAGKCAESDSPEILAHRLLFILIIAELTRNDNPMPYREEAAKIGARLNEMGRANPFNYYMKIIDQTTEVSSSESFGDFTTGREAAENAKELVEDLADKTLGFSIAGLSGAAKKFLFVYTISDLIKECGL